MANSVDPDQTAPAADDLSRQHFQMNFFLGALRVKVTYNMKYSIIKIASMQAVVV